MLVFQTKNIELRYLPEHRCLLQSWQGYTNSTTFREAIDQTVEFFRQEDVSCIISDTQHQGVVKKADSDYAAAKMPELLRLGLKKMAFVLPGNVFAQIAVDNFKTKSEDSLIQYFPSLEAAKKWIEKEKVAV